VRVFLAATSVRSAYGGPAFSVTRLAGALAAAGIDVGLWSPDKAASASSTVPVDSRVERLDGTESEALDRFGTPDVIHDNGMWLPHNHRLADLAGRRGIPRMVSTRGMLEPWARNHKRWKKDIAWLLYQRKDLQRASRHHATSEAEATNLRRFDLDVPITVIPNGIDTPVAAVPGVGRKDMVDPGGVKTALFVGRIYPIKGLPMLIEAWARVRPVGWRLRIAGPDEAGHLAVVERAVSDAGLSTVISFPGPIEGDAKEREFRDADLFVLPTYSESFGMAVAEALVHGLPVLTTTGAPWPELASRGCGWRVDTTVDGIARGLSEATALDAATLNRMGALGHAWMAADFSWNVVAQRFTACYGELVRGR
jgi:glycosyltransferase involved in cell wall biosynthesis